MDSEQTSPVVTVTQAGGRQLIGVSLRSGPEESSTPLRAACYRYDGDDDGAEAPILSLDQGTVHAQLSCADRGAVCEADVRTARLIAEAALGYFEAMLRARANQTAID
ncbi:hypothetical protein [Streptomonospora salina]|uniref:Uncharacterized protein n=1 Tax=Streptomonospora salina TaxID=104205 RepID=A0A841E6D8_9ACTN|nr:hypothetical protein [Streptomonospora salina]MBB5998725.1 hypothetical protein [Streptomonospora salina]